MQVVLSAVSRFPTHFCYFFAGEELKGVVGIAIHYCQLFVTYVDVPVKLDYVTNE